MTCYLLHISLVSFSPNPYKSAIITQCYQVSADPIWLIIEAKNVNKNYEHFAYIIFYTLTLPHITR